MTDNKERIAELQYQIDKLSPMIKKELAAIDKDSTFAERFAAQVNAGTLENKKQELNELLAEQQENNLEIHLTGEGIGYGIAPVDTIFDMLTAFQLLLQRFLQSDVENEPSVSISDSIRKATQLKCVTFSPGSFKIRIAGPTIDDGLFNNDENMTNNLAFRKTVQEVFDVISAPDSAETINRVKERGKYAFMAYRNYIDNGRKHQLNVGTTWFKAGSNKANTISSTQFKSTLEQIKKYAIETIEEYHRGKFVGLNSENYTFAFASEIHPRTIHGKFAGSLMKTLTKLHISPFDDTIYSITLKKKIDATKKDPEYQLLSIEPYKCAK